MRRSSRKIFRHLWIPFLFASGGISGCSTVPLEPEMQLAPTYGSSQASPKQYSESVLVTASNMLGSPYRYGGSTPRGFDCSGLVYYSFGKAGIKVPRTTREQFRRSRAVALADMQAGDLVFFRLTSRKVSHVGIYAGYGRFIHAPSKGKRVSYADLSDPYWKNVLVGVRRF